MSFAGRLEPREYITRTGEQRVALEVHGVDLEYGPKPRSTEPVASDAGGAADEDIPF